MTRISGKGNGTHVITPRGEAKILADSFVAEQEYQRGAGRRRRSSTPLRPQRRVRARPRRRQRGPRTPRTMPTSASGHQPHLAQRRRPDNDINAVRTSDEAISIRNEQLLLDWGLAITWEQYTYGNSGKFTEPRGSIEFADPEMPWLLASPMGKASTRPTGSARCSGDPDQTPEEEAVFDDFKPGDPSTSRGSGKASFEQVPAARVLDRRCDLR